MQHESEQLVAVCSLIRLFGARVGVGVLSAGHRSSELSRTALVRNGLLSTGMPVATAATAASPTDAGAKRSHPEVIERDETAPKRLALLRDGDYVVACGWRDAPFSGGAGGNASANERSVFAGDLTLPLGCLPIHVPVKALKTAEDGSVEDFLPSIRSLVC